MSNIPLIINVISAATVAVGVAKYWYLGFGSKKVKRVCEYQIAGSILQAAYNSLIVHLHPELWGSLLFQPVLLWSVIMSVKGWKNAE